MAVAARMKSGTRPEAASSPGPVPAAAPARILVADDDHSIAELVRIYLAKQGFEVEVAHDGNEVSTRLRDSEFDLVVLDIMMPGPNGLQVLRALRQHSDLPVILLTAASTSTSASAPRGSRGRSPQLLRGEPQIRHHDVRAGPTNGVPALSS